MIYKTIFIILALLVIIWTVVPLQNRENFCSYDNFYYRNDDFYHRNYYLPYPEQIWNNPTRLQYNYSLYYPWYYMQL